MNLDDTIVAIATPPGRGGIGVVRLAGPESRNIVAPMLRLKHALEPGRAICAELVEPDLPREQARQDEPGSMRDWTGSDKSAEDQTAELNKEIVSAEHPSAHNQRIDEVVVTFFQKPHSYTTDDIVEISAHGSPVVLRHIVERALERGARMAEPGEFTMRAFLNGRLDLTQAEAVRDLIEAQTLTQARQAASQMGGALSRRVAPVKQDLVELIALMASSLSSSSAKGT